MSSYPELKHGTVGEHNHDDALQFVWSLIREVKEAYPINEVPDSIAMQLRLLESAALEFSSRALELCEELADEMEKSR